MKILTALCGGILLVGVIFPFYVSAATNADSNDTHKVYANSNNRADDWFFKPNEANKITSQDKKSQQQQADKEKDRYKFLLTDNGYDYYIDTRNARWQPMPHSGDEYIIDVWIKLVQRDDSGDYSYPEKYFLEHYYLRPAKQQIQFLSELEVTGRPNNEITERAYNMQNWENLVPGSIEDEIYHGVVKQMGKNKLGGKSSHGMSLRDSIEEYLRISL